MEPKKNGGLLEELEKLRGFLHDEKNHPGIASDPIPVLTDIAHDLRNPGTERQTLGRLSVTGSQLDDPSQMLPVSNKDKPTAQLKQQLRRQARLIIQDIIDEELVRVEAQLNRELNSYLEHLLDNMKYPPVEENS